MMNKVILEYIWLDGYQTPNLRSKIKIIEKSKLKFVENLSSENLTLDTESVPEWNFDGSSTMQATGSASECIIKPVRTYLYDNKQASHWLVLCEVYNTDGNPHESNTRCNLRQLSMWRAYDFWWGFEQEYFVLKDSKPVGFPKDGFPKPQGEYYCSVGNRVGFTRKLAESHFLKCLEMGIEITGINAEVAPGQWEYQCFAKNTLKACDDLWISRYVLYKLAEEYNYSITVEPKPVKGDWNGSGCHTNFSDKKMRDTKEKESDNILYFYEIIKRLNNNHTTDIKNYGKENHLRLTGLHETQHIDKFTYGVGDRGASIRIPNAVVENRWKGYLEDRRPGANCDPYKVTKAIMNSVLEIEISDDSQFKRQNQI